MVLFLPIKNRLQLKVQNLELGLGLAAAILILNYLGFVVIYLGAPLFADPAEANVASVSWLFQTGHSLYPSSDAAARYINNYGSCLYIIQGAFLAVLKPSFFSVKLAGCLAGIVSLFVSFLLFKKRLPFSFAIAGCALTSLYFLALTSATGLVTSSFWVRPDSLLLLCTTIGIFLAAYGNKWSAVFGSAIAFGISTNLKITALLHFLPVYVLVFQRFGIIYTLISLIGSALVAIAPFFLFSNISLSNYLAWLQQVGRKGINPEQVIKNGLWLGFVSLPTAIAALHLLGIHSQGFKQWLRQYWLYFLLFVPCAGVAAIVGATRGALENNMLPFVPLLLYPLSDLMKKVLGACSSKNKQWLGISTSISITTALAFMLSTSLTVYSTEAPLVSRLLNPSSKRIVYDIEQVVKAHRDISMGYGSSYPLSTYRPAFVFAGNPYLLDSASLMEMQASGLNNTPDNTLNAIKTCQIPSWLIPKNEKPFEVYNYYPPLQKLFSDEFRQIFKQHYTQQAQTEFYDIWVCK
ncbi:glycosyltransferase family 39 protein [Myxacorys almedinensis]|uniref:Uncharacterized protein n=1 Tax=Myxacorys almedinensis A TaxID=2690445 RepID=A0A8J7Z2U7_9CYAN|nr:glycosyltransferase family 39 protein [Myxacorys almedinensis]NDJ18669.1 hypothetical protein [Myxacorys almedinensis A]